MNSLNISIYGRDFLSKYCREALWRAPRMALKVPWRVDVLPSQGESIFGRPSESQRVSWLERRRVTGSIPGLPLSFYQYYCTLYCTISLSRSLSINSPHSSLTHRNRQNMTRKSSHLFCSNNLNWLTGNWSITLLFFLNSYVTGNFTIIRIRLRARFVVYNWFVFISLYKVVSLLLLFFAFLHRLRRACTNCL